MTEIRFCRFYPTVMTKVVTTLPPAEAAWITNYVANYECLVETCRENPASARLRNLKHEMKCAWLARMQNPEVFTAVTEKALEILAAVYLLLTQRYIKIVKHLADGFMVEKIGDLQLENINRQLAAVWPQVGPLVIASRRSSHQ